MANSPISHRVRDVACLYFKDIPSVWILHAAGVIGTDLRLGVSL
jgi:hypothetical protein